jgi:hypothetical protein
MIRGSHSSYEDFFVFLFRAALCEFEKYIIVVSAQILPCGLTSQGLINIIVVGQPSISLA